MTALFELVDQTAETIIQNVSGAACHVADLAQASAARLARDRLSGLCS